MHSIEKDQLKRGIEFNYESPKAQTQPSRVHLLIDTDEINENIMKLQNVETLEEGLNILVEIASHQQIDIPNEVLQHLINVLDHDFHSPESVLIADLNLIYELIASGLERYAAFFAGPDKIDMIFLLFPLQAAAKCIGMLLHKMPNTINRLLELGLLNKIQQDLNLQNPHFESCCLILTRILSSNIDNRLLQNVMNKIISLLSNDNDNIVSDAINTLAEFCSQSQGATALILESQDFINLLTSDDLDDLMISDLITMLSKIVESTESAEIIQHELIQNFILHAIHETSCIEEAMNFISGCMKYDNFGESACSDNLFSTFLQIGNSDSSFHTKTIAIQALCSIFCSVQPKSIDFEALISTIENNLTDKLVPSTVSTIVLLAGSSDPQISQRVIESIPIRDAFESIDPQSVSEEVYNVIQEFLNYE